MIAHNPLDCERCGSDMVLYGETFCNVLTGEHYDVPTMMRRYVDSEAHPVLSLSQG